jgi:hypothetical protein
VGILASLTWFDFQLQSECWLVTCLGCNGNGNSYDALCLFVVKHPLLRTFVLRANVPAIADTYTCKTIILWLHYAI